MTRPVVSMKVEGLRDLERSLAELPQATAKNVVRRTLIKAAQPFDAGWRQRVRVDQGALKASGGVSTKLSRRQKSQHKKQSDVEIFAGPGPLPQAITEEFGTDDQPPQGAVRASWDENHAAMLDAVAQGMGAEILKAAQRLARKAARLAAGG